jgi:hypothetical protein
VTKNIGSSAESSSVVATIVKSLVGKLDAFSPACVWIMGPAADVKRGVAQRCRGEARAIMWVPLDRPPEQIERLDVALLFPDVIADKARR